MPSRRSGPSFLQFAAVALLTVSVALGVVAFLTLQESARQRGKLSKLAGEVEDQRGVLRERDDDIQALRDVLGYDFSGVGVRENEDRATVVGATLGDIGDTAGPLARPTVREALRRLAAERDNIARERNALVRDKSSLLANYLALEMIWKQVVAKYAEGLSEKQDELLARARELREVAEAKDRQIEELRETVTGNDRQIASLDETLKKLENDKRKQEGLHRSTVRRLNEIIRRQDPQQFEVADGKITLIDRTLKMVWLDLGQADGLRTGLVFHVFDRDAARVGSRRQTKGAVRVTRIVGAHQAEATIVTEKSRTPILKSDLVYTPVWSPGRVERFAIVGLVDINGDGQSDLASVRRHVEDTGARISIWVDEAGQRTGGPIDMNIKFLIVGRTPSPSEGRTEDEKAANRLMITALTVMRREAYDHGIRIVSLGDFLSYVRYRPVVGSPSGSAVRKPGSGRSPGTKRRSTRLGPSRKVTSPPTTSGRYESKPRDGEGR